MRLAILALLVLLAAPARSDEVRAVDEVILPGISAFERAAQELADTALADCRTAAVLPAYHAARDAWGRIGDFRLGPTEQAALTIAFWPDDRASGLRALRSRPTYAAALPASARGFAGLDLMLGEAELAYRPDESGCTLVVSLATDLSSQAKALERAWADHAQLLRAPGEAGNLTYLDKVEVRRALYTQVLTALEFTRVQRIARPLGASGQPRPARAEAWRSGRSLPNVLAASRAAHQLGAALVESPTPKMDRALEEIEIAAATSRDHGFQDIADPQARLRLEILGQHVDALKQAVETEVGDALGIRSGFNALDGD